MSISQIVLSEGILYRVYTYIYTYIHYPSYFYYTFTLEITRHNFSIKCITKLFSFYGHGIRVVRGLIADLCTCCFFRLRIWAMVFFSNFWIRRDL